MIKVHEGHDLPWLGTPLLMIYIFNFRKQSFQFVTIEYLATLAFKIDLNTEKTIFKQLLLNFVL